MLKSSICLDSGCERVRRGYEVRGDGTNKGDDGLVETMKFRVRLSVGFPNHQLWIRFKVPLQLPSPLPSLLPGFHKVHFT